LKITRTVTVANPNGLHARPAMQIVECATGFESDIQLIRPTGDPEAGVEDGAEADAKSVMQVVTLAATQGTDLTVQAEGSDAEQATQAIADLFADSFGGID
jgi:phosphotransferase system HPr (HPr) family protein